MINEIMHEHPDYNPLTIYFIFEYDLKLLIKNIIY